MNDFIATNGDRVSIRSDGCISIESAEFGTAALAQCRLDALREFFRAEEDERLGRWRWPEDHNFVVYPVGEDGLVDVLREDSRHASGPGRQQSISRDQAENHESLMSRSFFRAAKAYFDAHPEPKPWYDANDGEVWALTIDGKEDVYVIFRTEQDGFRMFPARSTVFRPGAFPSEVTAGHRIYPEPN